MPRFPRAPRTTILWTVALFVVIRLGIGQNLFGETHDCAKKSVGHVPSWYATECLGQSPTSPRVPQRLGAPNVAGNLSYIKTNFIPPPGVLEVKTAPLPTLTFTTVGPQALSIDAMDFDNSATTLWAIDNTNRKYGTIDLGTGAFTVVGTVTGIPPLPEATTGLKFDPTSAAVYLSTNSSSTTSSLYTLNLVTGAATLVGPLTGSIVDIAISNGGQMYGHEIAADNLVKIDKATGAETIVGPTGLVANFAQGMDFDPSDGTLYGYVYVTTPTAQGELVTFNLTTGAATMVAGPVSDEMEGAIKVAVPTATPTALTVDPTGNQVFDPNETASVDPTWMNTSVTSLHLTGTLSNFTGPGTGIDPVYAIVDGSADYGTVAPSASAPCTVTPDCYSLQLTTVVRPVQHWDATVDETISPPATVKTWTLHVGGSFADVDPSIAADPYYPFIETIFHKQVTAGCGDGTTYCPLQNNLRSEMAVFLLKAFLGVGYAPPACTGKFSDVPCPATPSFPFSDWIEDLSTRGITGGCSSDPGPPPTIQFCPDRNILRSEMAVFLMKTSQGPSYVPPACTGIFSDVPCPATPSFPFSDWIEDIYTRLITAGCGSNPGPPPTIQFCPDNSVLRQQMAVFLTKTFGLVLYGP